MGVLQNIGGNGPLYLWGPFTGDFTPGANGPGPRFLSMPPVSLGHMRYRCVSNSAPRAGPPEFLGQNRLWAVQPNNRNALKSGLDPKISAWSEKVKKE